MSAFGNMSGLGQPEDFMAVWKMTMYAIDRGACQRAYREFGPLMRLANLSNPGNREAVELLTKEFGRVCVRQDKRR